MTFNSVHFVLFFVTVCALYSVAPPRARWALLLAASCYFYMALVPAYIIILAGVILTDYFAAILIEGAATIGRRRVYLLLSLVANLGLLGVFKYASFVSENLRSLAALVGWSYGLPALKFVLPLGLSFHTFQSISYTIEVYRGKYRAERHLGTYALYVLFFPQAVAGPIERPQQLLTQLRARPEFDADLAVDGLRLMLWGYFQKVVVADRLALIVNPIYAKPGEYSGSALLLATFAFSFQIYCDFCGYTNVARGAAGVLGYRLTENFRRPYLATSVADFWRRWHISLSSWFRDYVFIPLGGSAGTKLHRFRNILIVFLLSGLWHGANWTFAVWGLVNALYLIGYQLLLPLLRALERRAPPRVFRLAAISSTFLLTTLAWVFFRAATLTDVSIVVRRIFSASAFSVSGLRLGIGVERMVAAAFAIVTVLVADVVMELRGWDHPFAMKARWVRWSAQAALYLAVLNVGISQKIPFIYFQF